MNPKNGRTDDASVAMGIAMPTISATLKTPLARLIIFLVLIVVITIMKSIGDFRLALVILPQVVKR